MPTLSYNPALTAFANTGSIDEKSGIIAGMSVITTGEVKGHGLFADHKSLTTCLEAAPAKPRCFRAVEAAIQRELAGQKHTTPAPTQTFGLARVEAVFQKQLTETRLAKTK